MKKILNFAIILVISIVSVVSCKNDDVNIDVPSNRLVFTSEQNQGNQIRLNSTLTFGDVSTGIVSRVWTFPEGVANVTESNEEVVKALFTKVGEHNVTLKQVFEEDAFVDGVQRGRELDTTIVVTVIEPILIGLKGNYLNDDGSLGAALNMDSDAENKVEASKTVRYSFELVGNPQNIDWTIDGGDPDIASGDAEIDVVYKRLGNYDITVEASTNRPGGLAVASFTNLIKVIPSTDPVTLDHVAGKLDGTLTLEFNREIDETTVVSDEFSLTVENGVDIPVTIQSIIVDPAERNILIVTLSGDSVYVDDTVNVSYTAGSLFSLDGVEADSFVDITMGTFEPGENLLESTDIDYSFEKSADDTNWPYQFWGGIWELYDFSIDFTRFHTGERSGVIDMEANGGMIMAHDLGTFPLEKDQSYELGLWTYVEDVGNTPAGSNNPDLRFYWKPNPSFTVGPSPEFSQGYETNKWVYSSVLVTATESATDKQIMLRGFNEFNDRPIKIYIDDLFISKVDFRP